MEIILTREKLAGRMRTKGHDVRTVSPKICFRKMNASLSLQPNASYKVFTSTKVWLKGE